MSEFSHLSEKIPERLQGEAFSVYLWDGNAVSKRGEIHSEQEITNPYALDLNQFIPNPPIRLEEFAELVSNIITDVQTREGIVTDEQVQLVREYNPEHFPTLGEEVITFKILRREPAKLDKKATSRPNRGFSHSYEYQNPNEPNKVLAIEHRPIDHKIELCVWSQNSVIADRRALWLERTMLSHKWIFGSKGVNPFYWMERGPDTVWISNGVRLHQRPLQFFARLQEYSILAFPTLREFAFNLNLET